MTSKKSDTQATNRKLRRFYLLLSELFIGLYPDSRALSIGPINREGLSEKVKASYVALSESSPVSDEIVFKVKSDFDRVTRLVETYKSIPQELSKEREKFLERQDHERVYLTREALQYTQADYPISSEESD